MHLFGKWIFFYICSIAMKVYTSNSVGINFHSPSYFDFLRSLHHFVPAI